MAPTSSQAKARASSRCSTTTVVPSLPGPAGFKKRIGHPRRATEAVFGLRLFPALARLGPNQRRSQRCVLSLLPSSAMKRLIARSDGGLLCRNYRRYRLGFSPYALYLGSDPQAASRHSVEVISLARSGIKNENPFRLVGVEEVSSRHRAEDFKDQMPGEQQRDDQKQCVREGDCHLW